MKNKPSMQFKISQDDERGKVLVGKINQIAKKNGLSPTDIAKLALAAGLPMVESKMGEIVPA